MAAKHSTPIALTIASLVFMVLIASPHVVHSEISLSDASATATGKGEVRVSRLPRQAPPAPRANENPIEPPPTRKAEAEARRGRRPRRAPPAPRANTPVFPPPPRRVP